MSEPFLQHYNFGDAYYRVSISDELIVPNQTTSFYTTPLVGMITINPMDGIFYWYDGTTWNAPAGTGTVTNIATGTGLTGGPITTTGTISLANTAVTAGSYTSANITVDAQGRITSAANGSSGTGTVTSVTLANGTGITLSGTNPITTSGTITITNSAPDQTVVLSNGTGISVTGTYPSFTITNTSPSSGGTVTSVSALTLGTTGTDLTSSVANPTTTPVITLNVPTASASNRGALSSTDWSTFNAKQPAGNYITALTSDVTASGPGSAAATIATHAVTYAKMQQASTVTLLGNPTGSLANISEITLGSGLSFSGTSLVATGSGGTVTSVGLTSSDITVGGSSPITTSGTFTLTLPNVNSDIGTFNTLTINAKGQVTAGSNTSYEVPLTFSTGLTRTVNTITVNTSQNIATLSNLTTNGLVYVTGGVGTLNSGPLSGDITTSGVVATIANNAVTYAKMQAVSTTSKLLGSSSTTTPVQEITLGSGLSLAGTTLSASGSGGTVTSVSGTTNRVTSTGGTTPVIDISAAYVGQTSITTLGTVTTGTLSTGTVIGGVTMTVGSDATGDIYYRNSSGILTRLGIGSSTTVLHGGTIPSYSAVDLANDVTGNLGISHLNSGTSASSSTFWRGDGTWATPSGSGTSTPTANTNAQWDSNVNFSANAFIPGYTTTVTSAGTLTITVTSTQDQFFTGTTTHTLVLPVTSTLVLGQYYRVSNGSTGSVTVQSSGANTIAIVPAGSSAYFTCILTSGTTASSWSFIALPPFSSSNTALNGVIRDASGNFAAGTITATLSGNASTVTTNANLTGPITSSGNATSIASQTGTGTTFMVATDPALTVSTPTTTSVGYLGIPQNSKSAAYTTVMSDAGKHLYHPGADTTARTWTIDSNANVAYPIGTTLTFINDTSGGVITIAITSDTMILAGAGTTGSRTLAANGIATAVKMTSTRWIINGTGLS